jgi:WD40 repeat protein
LVEETIPINTDEYFSYEHFDAYYSPVDPNTKKMQEEDEEDGNTRLHKTMGKAKRIQLTTKFLVCWKNNILFETYQLQKCFPENFPVQYTKNFLFFSQYVHSKAYEAYQKNLAAQIEESLPAENFRLIQRILFYPITCTAVSQKNLFLAIGCSDGTIILWDLELAIIKSTMDKHQKAVSCLCFYEQWMLCSGGLDGNVHLYDISAIKSDLDWTIFMDKKNFFTINSREKIMENTNEIVQMCKSEAGLLLVLDKHGHGRIYSLYHGNKVYKLLSTTTFSMADQNSMLPVTSFKSKPTFLVHGHKEQFVIISQKTRTSNDPQVINNGVLIYKVFDC